MTDEDDRRAEHVVCSDSMYSSIGTHTVYADVSNIDRLMSRG